MLINQCRICGGAFFSKPLLEFSNMPKAAQYMPDAASLQGDRGVDLTVCQCSACGLVQLNNDPVPYYREVIRAVGVSKEMKDFRSAQFKEFISKYSLERKKIIEIGCGRGDFLSILEDFDVNVFGIEFSQDAVRHCHEKGLKVERAYIEQGNEALRDNPFDAFLILNYFEHLPDPGTTLKGIHSNLADHGIGLIEVPNFNMILQKNLFSEFIGDHLFYFTGETLRSTIERFGFEVLDCQEIWHDYILSITVQKRKPLDISPFYQQQENIKQDILTYIRRFEDQTVAVWGAGHQALAVISLTNIRDKIRYVIDSAPFKQGKYTPATHVPIVSPEMLKQDPVDAVIVMAASYSDEVASLIQREFLQIRHVAILREAGLEEVLP